MIIGIAGQMRTGKSTLAQMLMREMFADRTVQIKSFAEELRKEVAEAIFSHKQKHIAHFLFAEKETENKSAIRPLLQAFGQAKRDLVDEDYWVDALVRNRIPTDVLIIDDVRHKNEADWVLANGGILIRLHAQTNVLYDRGAQPERLAHYSETAMQTPSDLETEYPHRVLSLDTSGMSPLGMFKRLKPFLLEMIGDDE